jgi:hypothetical protein
MGRAWTRSFGCSAEFTEVVYLTLEGTVSDLLYIGLTIVVFAALFLLIKGVERFER